MSGSQPTTTDRFVRAAARPGPATGTRGEGPARPAPGGGAGEGRLRETLPPVPGIGSRPGVRACPRPGAGGRWRRSRRGGCGVAPLVPAPEPERSAGRRTIASGPPCAVPVEGCPTMTSPHHGLWGPVSRAEEVGGPGAGLESLHVQCFISQTPSEPGGSAAGGLAGLLAAGIVLSVQHSWQFSF